MADDIRWKFLSVIIIRFVKIGRSWSHPKACTLPITKRPSAAPTVLLGHDERVAHCARLRPIEPRAADSYVGDAWSGEGSE